MRSAQEKRKFPLFSGSRRGGTGALCCLLMFLTLGEPVNRMPLALGNVPAPLREDTDQEEPTTEEGKLFTSAEVFRRPSRKRDHDVHARAGQLPVRLHSHTPSSFLSCGRHPEAQSELSRRNGVGAPLRC